MEDFLNNLTDEQLEYIINNTGDFVVEKKRREKEGININCYNFIGRNFICLNDDEDKMTVYKIISYEERMDYFICNCVMLQRKNRIMKSPDIYVSTYLIEKGFYKEIPSEIFDKLEKYADDFQHIMAVYSSEYYDEIYQLLNPQEK